MNPPSPAQPGVPAIAMSDVALGAMRDPSVVVAQHINWKVAAGEFWVIAGLQGSGKSDFLMLTGGLMPPVSGSYRFFDEEMPIFEDARMRERLRLGLVFDGGQLFNHLTVWENIALPLRYHRNLSKADALPEVQKLLQLMELEPWAASTPGAIGRNWQKRVGLARALILQPEVLLIDNPLTGLDLRHVLWWLNFLGQLSQGHPYLQDRPATLVVTTADLRSWKGRAHHFAILRNQRFNVLGSWAQLEAASAELVHELLTLETRGG
ncbi:MAG TPA: ATP-binding cassette domain-containing protein [Candidatus Sulfotelmatobacter sp.]|nr:ATP-binding cassette domain-containing protein [Candidatus Sulfotelmatobacter sp.]